MTWFRFLLLALLLAILPSANRPARADMPPAPLVGRVAAIDGRLEINFANGVPGSAAGGGVWADSQRNDPIAAGMALRTEANGGALLRVGADAIALAPATEIAIARLDAGGMRLVLRRGRIGIRLSPIAAPLTAEVVLPSGALTLTASGQYDVSAGDDRTPSRVSVFDGEARFAGKDGQLTVADGAAAALGGTVAGDGHATADDFDRWWRFFGGDSGEALRYVSAAMTGYDMLDANGAWQDVSGYGAVWFPKGVAADWAPYRFGHWRSIRPWGWTWIDDANWGFAPSHFGRWARIAAPAAAGEPRPRWGWVPGERIADPLYMPAAVAFVGTAGVGLSCPNGSGPAIAWFPLAPGEAYWPGYPADLAAIRRMNAGTVPNPDEIGPAPAAGGPPAGIANGHYRNRRFASVVPRSAFVAGCAVASALLQLPEPRLENAPLLGGSPQIPPASANPPAVVAALPAKPTAKSASQRPARTAKLHGPVHAARLPSARLDRLATMTRRAREWRRHIVSAALSRHSAHHASHRRVAAVHRR